MKSKKLKLDQIKVSSFITEIDQIKGGFKTSSIILKTQNAECDGDTKVYCSKDVICDIKYTFGEINTGGCKHTDIGCITDKLTKY